jgi:uncharacterized protein YecE (DUF72 family)
MNRLFLGTSGYSYQHWKGVFYPQGLAQTRWLEFYCRHFTTVELNVTFYRLPSRKAFEGWFQKTPDNFSFAAKGSRFITHVKKLRDCREPLLAYKENATGLKEKLAVILWQLPPNLHYDGKRLEEFCQILTAEYPEKRHAFEFRHESWLNEECYTILSAHGYALCIPVGPGYPKAEEITAPFLYIRFHSGEVMRNSCFTDKELKQWAAKIKGWLKSRSTLYKNLNGDPAPQYDFCGQRGPVWREMSQGDRQDVYCYFNNDVSGFAIANAKRLRDYIT